MEPRLCPSKISKLCSSLRADIPDTSVDALPHGSMHRCLYHSSVLKPSILQRILASACNDVHTGILAMPITLLTCNALPHADARSQRQDRQHCATTSSYLKFGYRPVNQEHLHPPEWRSSSCLKVAVGLVWIQVAIEDVKDQQLRPAKSHCPQLLRQRTQRIPSFP